MDGSRAIRCLGALLIVGCAGKSGTTEHGGDGSGGAVGAAGTGAGGSAGAFIDELMASASWVCREVKRCYPELQTDPSRCAAPGDEGRSVVWSDPAAAFDEETRGRIEACFGAVEDQDALRAWAECSISAERDEAECLASCPPSAEACVLAGNAAQGACAELREPVAAAVEGCPAG